MRVLVVCSYNFGKIFPFISEQVESLQKKEIILDYYLIKGKGISGYLKNLEAFKQKIKSFEPDLIHAHYGFTGLFSNLQRKIPVVTTYHGSDINMRIPRLVSYLSIILSYHNIFVSKSLAEKVMAKRKMSIVPCGVNKEIFRPLDKIDCRLKLGLDTSENIILFSHEFSNKVKNYTLAKAAADLLPGIKLIELKGYSREEVSLLLNACDVALMTSHTEGSPNFIKEAMFCNTPIVSTPVGDVREVIGDTSGCFLTSFNTLNVMEKISLALNFKKKTNGRIKCLDNYDQSHIAIKIVDIFSNVLNRNSDLKTN